MSRTIRINANTRIRMEYHGDTPPTDKDYEPGELLAIAAVSQAQSLKRIANALERLEKKPSVGLNAEDIYQMTRR